MPLNPNFAAQRLCYHWYGPAYYDGLALAFAGRLVPGTTRYTAKREAAADTAEDEIASL